ncbi:SIR2 family protein [Enterococcus hirae]
MRKDIFIKKYAKAIQEGNAAVFAGAGISISAGVFSWKDLVKPFAEEMGLDIEKEYDLTRVIQYYINEKKNRHTITQKIVNIVHEETTATLDILTDLPIQTYWTTNYDRLIEKNLERKNKKVDTKVTDKNLATNIFDRDAIVYKMHGDISNPDEVILAKEDYELYNHTHSLFTTALRGDLVTKTFLFIGFSFEDPNLDNILSRIKILLGKETREHYCFLKQVMPDDFDRCEDYQNALTKQNLRIDDLRRYGIETILLDSYDEIPSILDEVNKAYLSKNIFISGSISSYEKNFDEDSVNEFCFRLSNNLVENNCKIISGFGLGIGSNIINGALDKIYAIKFKHVSEHLSLHPFPQIGVEKEKLKESWTKLRHNMISESGICIFIFGNKIVNGEVQNASGMLEEYEIAKKMNRIIIPVGSTGGASRIIFDKMKNDKENFHYLENYWDLLEQEDLSTLLKVIVEIVIENKI